VPTVPGGREPGYHCDPDAGIRCVNVLCIDGFCAAVCASQATCDQFPGMACQTVFYEDDHGTAGEISACALEHPGETRCGHTPDCAASRVCGYRSREDDVITVCRTPVPGGGQHGDPCTQGTDCENNLCACGDGLCNGEQGTCSAICVSDADCLQGYDCATLRIPDLQGVGHDVQACVRDPDACGRDADCPPGECCQLFVSDDGQSLETLCYWGSGPGESNTGEDCTDGSACCTAYCHDYPGYCLGLCIGDDDCPRWTSNACSGDADCDLGYLCDSAAGACTRSFQCTTIPMTIGYDDTGMPIVDTADACTPLRRTCQLNDDCRPGEACKIYYNQDATAAEFQCSTGGPGTAESGESCYPEGHDACWTGLCLFYIGGGEGLQFCTEPCLADSDCGDPAVFYCATLQVYVRPGFTSYLPVCALRDP